MTAISDMDISVVVQGPIIWENSGRSISAPNLPITKLCMLSLRKHFPNAEIILSTWEGSQTGGLPFDKLVMSIDPGASVRDEVRQKLDTTNRQIVSTVNGIRVASRTYILKIRTDMLFVSDKLRFVYAENCALEREGNFLFLSNRVLISSVTSFDVRKKKAPFHACDWLYFGLKQDLYDVFDIPLMPDPEFTRWYQGKTRPFYDINPTNLSRYHAETWILKSWLAKHLDVKFEHTTDIEQGNVELSEAIFANNLIVMSPAQLGFRSLIHDWDFKVISQNYTYNGWLRLVKKRTGSREVKRLRTMVSCDWSAVLSTVARYSPKTSVKFDDPMRFREFLKGFIVCSALMTLRILGHVWSRK